MNTLNDKIFEIIATRKRVKAVQIAKALGVSRVQVNQLLYGELSNKFIIDNDWYWRVAEDGELTIPEKIFNAVAKAPQGIMAKEISEQIGVRRSDVNHFLYGSLNQKCMRDAKFRWFVAE